MTVLEASSVRTKSCQSLHVCSHLSVSRKLTDLNISSTNVSGNSRKSKPRGMIMQCSIAGEKGHGAAQGDLSMHRMSQDRCARVVSNLVELSTEISCIYQQLTVRVVSI